MLRIVFVNASSRAMIGKIPEECHLRTEVEAPMADNVEIFRPDNGERAEWYRQVALLCREQRAISEFWRAEWKIIITLAVGIIALGIWLFGLRFSLSLPVAIGVIIWLGVYYNRLENERDQELEKILPLQRHL